MGKEAGKRSSELLKAYASKNAAEARRTEKLREIEDPDVLFSLLATRVTDPAAMFATPGDRYGSKFNEGDLAKGGPMVEVGKRIFLRCANALHDFICKPEVKTNRCSRR
jgi:hypothetical protein